LIKIILVVCSIIIVIEFIYITDKLKSIFEKYRELKKNFTDSDAESYQYQGNDTFYIYPVFLKKDKDEEINKIVEEYNRQLNFGLKFIVLAALFFVVAAIMIKVFNIS